MFWDYRQNNSGGRFDIDDARGISCYIIIEADSPDDANRRAEGLGLYFDGCAKAIDCNCCGDRWYPVRDAGDMVPSVYGRSVYDPFPGEDWGKWTSGPEGYIHYKDGRVEPFDIKYAATSSESV